MAPAAAVILAGGRGERLGGAIKANIEIDGERLIERVVAAVGGAHPILVASGNFSADELAIPRGGIAVPDAGRGGPMRGVAGAVAWLETRSDAPPFLLSVAVDTPFFPPAFLDLALAQIGEADAVVAAFDGQDYPTNALWRLDAVRPHLGDTASLKRLMERIRVVRLDWRQWSAEDPFVNVNTPADLEEIKRRASGKFGVGKSEQTR